MSSSTTNSLPTTPSITFNDSPIPEDSCDLDEIFETEFKSSTHNSSRDRHLNLTILHLKLWTTEIIKNAADFDNLPNGPLFNMMNSIKV
ncbi:hypothetical protein GLOIN_2v1791993 [Rhizophagus clarus]|uniref:Uncharacterized protein n=1 Tax=Rhizophagus clarus TaxID=94130 RepID=A0A8H3QWS1_9GLOM|nr:hypothetical protein GLOIN_2v1791993 [Rhizophagus clarus]